MATIAATREVSDGTEMLTVTRENPPEPAWAAFLAGHGPGDVITATVTQTLPFGALVRSGGVPGLRTDVTGPDRRSATASTRPSVSWTPGNTGLASTAEPPRGPT
jgi:hypothetical protein